MKSFPILPITEVKSSGALPPAAIIVAPATSSDMSSFSVITLVSIYPQSTYQNHHQNQTKKFCKLPREQGQRIRRKRLQEHKTYKEDISNIVKQLQTSFVSC